MQTNLTANREIKDYAKEDAFNFKMKADVIKTFLEFNTLSLTENKMLALYGSWGSGKTSLMRYLEDKIDKGIYFPIFFEAWEHEKDDNLALSLCDALVDQLANDKVGIITKFKKNAISVLKGFTKALSVKIGNPLTGNEINFEGAKFIEELDKQNENESFFKKNKEFKESFKEVEEAILKSKKATRIVVFIDDLDRCEPENVLNLITALKLFFTYGEHTIFFTGLDKEAVTKAVKTKYQDVVKSEEYLEKVFDISFGMPKTFSLQKYLSTYFEGEWLTSDGSKQSNVVILEDFFKSIGFTNPRHIKKVLNKYEILTTFKFSAELNNEIRSYIPNIIFKRENPEGNIFETILCIYFIILYENFPERFEELEDYKRKHNDLLEPYINSSRFTNSSASLNKNALADNLEVYNIPDVKDVRLSNLFKNGHPSAQFAKVILFFAPGKPQSFMPFYDSDISLFNCHFTDNDILTLFSKFLISYRDEITMNNFSDYIFWNYFNMAKYLL